MSESFFSRWSRRKHEAGQEDLPADRLGTDVPPRASKHEGAPGPARQPLSSDGNQAQGLEASAASGHAGDPSSALPTLDDVQALTPESNFQPFMQRGVGADVRNAAMKKLFADPHFNVMDGLGVYIDDYSQPDPMPSGMLRQMASAQFLKLVPEEAPAQQASPAVAPPLNPAPADGIQVVAQSPDSSASADPRPHDDPHLQLQPDPAPADPQPEPGPR